MRFMFLICLGILAVSSGKLILSHMVSYQIFFFSLDESRKEQGVCFVFFDGWIDDLLSYVLCKSISFISGW